MQSQVNLILTDGGAGDLICCLVAANHNIKTHPDIHFNLWMPDYLTKLAQHLIPNAAVFPFSKAKKEFDGSLPGRTTQWFTHGHTPMRTHPVDYGFHMLSDCHIYDISQKYYLQVRKNEIDVTKYKLPKDYFCIVATSATPIKALPIETMNAVSQYVLKRGLTPVYLGREEESCGYEDFKLKSNIIEADFSSGVNLINKTSLLEAAGIIANSRGILGMDSGLIHLAGCTDVPIIAGYTLVAPSHITPLRPHGVTYPVIPDQSLPNVFFQTNNLFYTGDARTFPGWERVIGDMTFSRFELALARVLRGNS